MQHEHEWPFTALGDSDGDPVGLDFRKLYAGALGDGGFQLLFGRGPKGRRGASYRLASSVAEKCATNPAIPSSSSMTGFQNPSM